MNRRNNIFRESIIHLQKIGNFQRITDVHIQDILKHLENKSKNFIKISKKIIKGDNLKKRDQAFTKN